ncbi:hypothetical protein CVT25_000239 [Psilocybe cyanescens]|uniref:Uncharacterized protein n=1 Tax=Psilocybe cyanescens TaxID=93625 RepID=A0A409W1W7_PSICY|nr:hypothetical protein CVT25_000239 [Psilocybe cyanescens]
MNNTTTIQSSKSSSYALQDTFWKNVVFWIRRLKVRDERETQGTLGDIDMVHYHHQHLDSRRLGSGQDIWVEEVAALVSTHTSALAQELHHGRRNVHELRPPPHCADAESCRFGARTRVELEQKQERDSGKNADVFGDVPDAWDGGMHGVSPSLMDTILAPPIISPTTAPLTSIPGLDTDRGRERPPLPVNFAYEGVSRRASAPSPRSITSGVPGAAYQLERLDMLKYPSSNSSCTHRDRDSNVNMDTAQETTGESFAAWQAQRHILQLVSEQSRADFQEWGVSVSTSVGDGAVSIVGGARASTMEGDASDGEDEQEDEVGYYLNGSADLEYRTRALPSSPPSAPSTHTSCTPPYGASLLSNLHPCILQSRSTPLILG